MGALMRAVTQSSADVCLAFAQCLLVSTGGGTGTLLWNAVEDAVQQRRKAGIQVSGIGEKRKTSTSKW